jgi:hypothetical protein
MPMRRRRGGGGGMDRRDAEKFKKDNNFQMVVLKQ